MLRGIIASLIAAVVFFALGELSVEVLGTRGLGEGEFEEMELFEDAPKMTELVAEYKFVGEQTWEFDPAETLGIVSNKVKTKVKKVDGNKITLTVKTDGARNAAVAVSGSEDGSYLGISVRENGGVAFWNGGDTRVEIGLPDKVLSGLEIELGSGELKAADIKAAIQIVDVGSGKMELSHAADYEARVLAVELHSGKFTAADIKADTQTLDIGSGQMEFAQAKDFEAAAIRVELHSGSFSGKEIKAKTAELEIGSGVLKFAQGEGFKGERLNVDIGSGNVTVTNADTSEYEISLSSGLFNVSGLTGSGEINVGSGSGSADFAAIDPRGSSINLSSGSLKVYLPKGAGASLEAEVSSGSVTFDCGGASGKLKDGQTVVLGDDGGKFAVDVSSGKVSFLDSKEFSAQPVQITQVTVTKE